MSKIVPKAVKRTSLLMVMLALATLALVLLFVTKGSFFGGDTNKVVATTTLNNYELRLNGVVSWDNYCRLTTLTILNRANNDSQELTMTSPFFEHCLNGTGEAGYNWFNIVDINNDGSTDIGVISGHSLDNKPTYSYFVYSPQSSNFTKQADSK